MNVIWTMRNVLIARFFRFVSSALYLLKSESVFKQPVEFFYTNRAHTELRSHCDGMLQHRIFLPHIYVRLLSSSCDMCVVYYRPRSIRAAGRNPIWNSHRTRRNAQTGVLFFHLSGTNGISRLSGFRRDYGKETRAVTRRWGERVFILQSRVRLSSGRANWDDFVRANVHTLRREILSPLVLSPVQPTPDYNIIFR